MARRGGEPNSASSEWFVSYKDNSFLDSVDGGFTVFGEVRGDGMTFFDALDILSTSVPPNPPNGMLIVDLNQDADNDGVRDDGVFWNGTNDGVPLLFGYLSNLVVVQDAEQIDYYGGTGSSTTLNFPAGGLTISTRDVFVDTGTNFTGTGGLTIGAGRTLGTREGVFLNRNVNNLGTLAPGLSNAAITLPSYQQGASGTLAVDIRGTAVDTHYDRLAVTGAAQLAGKLEVNLLNLYDPVPGDTFTILTAGPINGSFSSFDFAPLTGFLWGVEQTATEVKLQIIAGDYNNDGAVDAADYTVWRNTLGSTYSAAYAGADGNGDKTVNAADYDIWKINFGRVDGDPVSGAGVGAADLVDAVPEPSSMLLVVMAGAVLARLASRRGQTYA